MEFTVFKRTAFGDDRIPIGKRHVSEVTVQDYSKKKHVGPQFYYLTVRNLKKKKETNLGPQLGVGRSSRLLQFSAQRFRSLFFFF